jgi:outer membrane protein assembly factor BamB
VNGTQATARLLALILALFIAAMLAGLLMMHRQAVNDGLLTSTRMKELNAQLIERPADATLREAIRQADRELRQAELSRRSRYQLAGYLLLASVIGLVLALKRAYPAAPGMPDLTRLAGPSEETRPRAVRTVLTVGGAAFVALAWGGITGNGAGSRAGLQSAASTGGAPEAGSQFQQNWPGFRGAVNLGLAEGDDWPTTWSLTEARNIVWSVPLPVEGHSSPVIWGDRIFLSGGGAEEQRVACFDRTDGALLWNAKVPLPPSVESPEPSEDTGFAAPTPVTDGRRVYAMFANGMLAAFDFDGQPAWNRPLGTPDSIYGYAASPLLAGGVLIIQFDQSLDAEEGKSLLLGINPEDGSTLWSTPRPVPNSWSSPSLVEADGHPEVITMADPWVIAYDPASGRELWRSDGLRGDVAASPAAGGGLVFVSNDGARLMALRPGGQGDVTETHRVWESDLGMPDIASPVSDGARMLQAYGNEMTCFDARTGELLWDEMLDSSACASPILAGGLVYLTTMDGMTRIFDWTDGYSPRGGGEIGEPVHATPAFADGMIYMRGSKHLVCVGEPS